MAYRPAERRSVDLYFAVAVVGFLFSPLLTVLLWLALARSAVFPPKRLWPKRSKDPACWHSFLIQLTLIRMLVVVLSVHPPKAVHATCMQGSTSLQAHHVAWSRKLGLLPFPFPHGLRWDETRPGVKNAERDKEWPLSYRAALALPRHLDLTLHNLNGSPAPKYLATITSIHPSNSLPDNLTLRPNTFSFLKKNKKNKKHSKS